MSTEYLEISTEYLEISTEYLEISTEYLAGELHRRGTCRRFGRLISERDRGAW